MDKPAHAEFPIADLIARRWSPRAFNGRPLDTQTLRTLLEAARWAPSSSNEQPWFFLVASKQDPAEFDKMLGCLVPGNQRWAKNAGALLISVAAMNWQRNNHPNRHAFHDVGLASENLMLQATAMGLGTHPMAGFDVEKTRQTYAIPGGCEPVAAMAIGYPADPSILDDDLRTRETAARTRKPQRDFVFTGSWGKSMI